MITLTLITPFLLFLLCHLVGDYIFQTDWMAMNKSKKTLNCLVHCLIYTSCFLLLTFSWKALLFIFATHFILDRWPIIIKRMIWWKNHFPTMSYPLFKYCDTTGYYDDSPYNSEQIYKDNWCDLVGNKQTLEKYGKPRHFFITVWLYIVSDNTLHLICNGIALLFLI